MKDLRDIVNIYDDLLDNKSSRNIKESFNSNEQKLFELYKSGVSDNTISKKLYNASPSHQSFQSLKKSFRNKLYSIIITANVGQYYAKQRLDVSREVLVIKTLNTAALRSISSSIAEKTLKKCLKFHMYHEAADLARLLSEHYAVFTKNKVKAVEYHDLALDCLENYRTETYYAWQYQSFRSMYGTPVFDESAELFRQTADELNELFHLNNVRLLFYYFEIRFFQFYVQKDYQGMIKTCESAVEHINALDFDHKILRNIFIFHQIEIHLNYRAIDKAKSLIVKFLDNTDKKAPGYYRYKELLLRLNLYEANIKDAIPLFRYLKNNIRKLSNIYTRDRLLIYELYLSILQDKEVNFRRLNYNLNKVKQDKKGLHVPYLIAQSIYFYLNDPDKLIDKLNALNQYSYKYLKGEKFERTRQFIKTINLLMDGKHISEFNSTAPSESLNDYGLEMVSYEKLLQLMLAKR